MIFYLTNRRLKFEAIKEPLQSFKMPAIAMFFLFVGYISFGQHIPKVYTAFYTNEDVDIDGVDNEKTWKEAIWSSNFTDIEGIKEPKYKTRIKMAWSPEYFYVFAKLEEPHVWGNLKQRDTIIFYNNDFEVFIDPDGDTHNYYELEINALNTVWDLFLTKPYRNWGEVIDSWDIQGLKSAINVEGSINNSLDQDVGWAIEIAIPWSVIVEASNSSNAPVNKFWRVNFSRVNWNFDLIGDKYYRKKDSNNAYLPEYNWVWSPQEVINMHEPERWGYVYFSDKSNSSGFQFKVPKEEKLKRKMYEYYRQLHKDSNTILPKELEIDGENISLHLDKHFLGWNLWVLSPYSKKKLIISKDGKFHRIKEKN